MTDNQLLWRAKGSLPVPASQQLGQTTLWTDYGIWGLDIYDNQPTWFSLIELMLVLTDRHRKNEPLLASMPMDAGGAPAHETIQYLIYYNDNLRHLMFRDQDVLPLSERNSTDQNALWTEWLSRVKKDFPHLELSYLQDAFNHDFNKLSEAIDLLRSAEVEPLHAKRWTSRHLQPLGEAVLFPDYALKPDGIEGQLDRRFFRRTGEIYYLMLSRAKPELKAALEPLVADRIFGRTSHWNRIAKKLQGPDAHVEDARSLPANSFAFLPQPSLARYDRLAEDWINILSRRSVPFEDALDYLMRVSALNEIVYIVEQAAATYGQSTRPLFYVDLLGNTGGGPVRSASIENYKSHKDLIRKAVEKFIHSYFEEEEWASLDDSAVDCSKAQKLLRDRFLFKSSHSDAHPRAKGLQAEELLEKAAMRSHSIGQAFTAHTRQLGLLSLKQGVGGWYTPSDAFLEGLVVANVEGTMEFQEFLKRLFDRYGFVIGIEEAKAASNHLPAPGESFVANERRFEERLRVLGFIDRKSDDCAFVINPFREGAARDE
jgi:hypothetical protein